MAMKDDRRVFRERFELLFPGGVEVNRRIDLRSATLFVGADVEEVDLLRLQHRLEILRGDLFHGGRRVRVLDFEAGAARAFDVVDRNPVGAPRARRVEEHVDAVRLHLDVAILLRGEVEIDVERSVDLEAQTIVAGLGRFAERLRGGVAQVDDRRLHRLDLRAEHLVEVALRMHLADDVAAADELTIHVELRDRRPVTELFDPVAERRDRRGRSLSRTGRQPPSRLR